MPNISLFKKPINTPVLAPSKILKKLNILTGCVFLQNNGSPVLGFLPKQYCTLQNQKNSVFIRNDNLNYSLEHPQSLSDFINIKNNNIHSNNKSFTGGYIGFISYDYAASQFIDYLEKPKQPLYFLGEYQSFLKFENNQVIFYSSEKNAQYLYNLISNLLNNDDNNNYPDFNISKDFQNRWTKQEYLSAFNQVQEYIKAGDCYQINLTQEFKTKCTGNLTDISHELWNLTNAPYAGYLNINNFELLSCSPELFIEFNNNNNMITRPIKGTMPRYTDPAQDQISRKKLQNSQKDQAENLMIVDLLRNDLSIYAKTGSVKTPKLFEIESFNQVHHMVSEISATLKDDVNPFEVLLSAMPGGSITGAPKIRAMQIIEELEGASRGAYCGSLGYFNYDGTGVWNILIRSIQKYQDELSIWAGGGITIASEAEAEYQECFDKVSAMLDLFKTWQKSE
nr:aminodeoxychorismate synthase component I [Acinetobacter sp. Marseille-Q1620]